MSEVTFVQVGMNDRYIVEEIADENIGLNDANVNLFIKLDDTYIGLISYTVETETAFIDQFTIHRDYRGYGFGTQAYFTFEQIIIKQGLNKITVNAGIHSMNFWQTKDFVLKKLELGRRLLEKNIDKL